VTAISTRPDFDPAEPVFQRDPHAVWARLREHCPVARRGAQADWWALTRYDDIVAAAADDRTFTSTRGVTIGEGIIGPPRFPMHYDPPQQTQYRRIINAPFLADNVALLEASFRQNTVHLLEQLLHSGGGEMVSAFTAPPCGAAYLGSDAADAVRHVLSPRPARGLDRTRVSSAGARTAGLEAAAGRSPGLTSRRAQRMLPLTQALD
jgi:hypothetical protein